MNRIVILGSAIAMATITASAVAQNTVGELLDAGARKLSQEDVLTAFSGATSSGKTAGGANGEFDFKADGTYSGMVQSPQGNAGVMGKWSATPGGRLCVEWVPVGRGVSKGGGCSFVYALAGQHYIADSEDRGTPVLKRTLRK